MPMPPTRLFAICLLALFVDASGAQTLSAMEGSAQQGSAAPQRSDAPLDTPEYRLGPGDAVRIQVFQNSDLTLETRVSEAGTITYPLIGTVHVGDLEISKAEALIARLLDEGGFVIKPQVTLLVTQIRGNDVSVLGQFNRPGRFPLETTRTRLSDMIAQAGGIAPNGADSVILVGVRDGKPFRREINLTTMFTSTEGSDDLLMQPGDVIYVQRAPQVYIYGEVQRAGAFRLERDMTLMQALAEGGGLTPRGTQRHVRVHRRSASGAIVEIEPKLDDLLQPDDVVYVRESLF